MARILRSLQSNRAALICAEIRQVVLGSGCLQPIDAVKSVTKDVALEPRLPRIDLRRSCHGTTQVVLRTDCYPSIQPSHPRLIESDFVRATASWTLQTTTDLQKGATRRVTRAQKAGRRRYKSELGFRKLGNHATVGPLGSTLEGRRLHSTRESRRRLRSNLHGEATRTPRWRHRGLEALQIQFRTSAEQTRSEVGTGNLLSPAN